MQERQINKARALYYNLFANFFVLSKDFNNYLSMRNLIDILKENPLNSESANALKNISSLLEGTSNVNLIQEYDDIFNSPITKKIRQTASYYDEGVESGKKRLEMINFVAKTKIRRNEKEFYEYEDSIGFIFSFLSELIDLVANNEKSYENTVHCIFEQVLNQFIDEFAAQLYEHESANIYKELMVVLHSFLEFERMYLGVVKPTEKTKQVEPNEVVLEISEEEKERRARNKELKKLGPKNNEACPVDIAYDIETDI